MLGDWYGEVSPDGREHWDVVARKLYEMHLVEPALTTADLATIANPDADHGRRRRRDPDRAHRRDAPRRSPTRSSRSCPGASHGLLVEKPALCNAMILEFLGVH